MIEDSSEKRKKSSRKRVKYPALLRRYNLKVRQEFIETEEYINGVKDSRGELVIRELTDIEKEFLNKFNAEVECNVFKNDGSDFYPKVNRKSLNKQNNLRNRDLYGQLRHLNKLVTFNPDEYDEYSCNFLDKIDFETLIIMSLEHTEPEEDDVGEE